MSKKRKKETYVDAGWRIPDELWARMEPLLPARPAHPRGGRPWTPDRRALDGLFYMWRNRCSIRALPREFGAQSTLHDRFTLWGRTGALQRLGEEGLIREARTMWLRHAFPIKPLSAFLRGA